MHNHNNETNHDRVSALFHELCDLTPSQWPERIKAQHLDPDTEAELEALLGDQSRPCPLLDHSLHEAFPNLTAPESVTIDDYEIIRRLGSGGMGIVYLAEDPDLLRLVAIKVLPSIFTHRPKSVQRFRNEAQALARLDHPNIVPVHRFGRYDDTFYIASAYIEGETLADQINRRRDSGQVDHRWITCVLEISRSIALALHYSHQHGVIHRDVKPANVLMNDEGTAHLSDFGIAKTVSAPGLTQTQETPGTTGYMSPEQAGFIMEQTGPRSDVYSLGVVLKECLTLERPSALYPSQSNEANNPIRIRRIDRSKSAALNAICAKALEWEPERRYQSAGDFAKDLDRVIAGLPVEARRLSPAHRLAWFARRHTTPIAISAATLAVAAIPATLWVLQPPTNGLIRIQAPPASSVSYQRYDMELQTFQDRIEIGVGNVSRSLPLGRYRFSVQAHGSIAEFTRVVIPGEPITIDSTVIPTPASTEEMVYIEGGPTVVGIPNAPIPGYDERTIALSPFWIDKAEVTNAQYRIYTKATGTGPAPLWSLPYNIDDDPYPVVGLTYKEARAFAEWAGKRLPTSWEWERAARGASGRLFPWGDEFDAQSPGNIGISGSSAWSLEFTDPEIINDVRRSLRPSASVNGSDITPEGAVNFYGNVAEFTDSPVPPESVGIPFGKAGQIIVKGKPWNDRIDPENTLYGMIPLSFEQRLAGVGFRCALSATD